MKALQNRLRRKTNRRGIKTVRKDHIKTAKEDHRETGNLTRANMEKESPAQTRLLLIWCWLFSF